jgi:hypothetical protein
MPASLDVTQTPNPVPVDTPSIVANLDTNTGPQASPAAFGPDLNGLAQGLDQANQDIQQTVYRGRYERMEQEHAQNTLWALNQHTNLDKEWTGKFMTAEANGQPLNPDKFNSDFQTQVDNVAATAPNDMARASFMSYATELGGNLYKQNLGAIARVNAQQRQAQAQNVIGQYVDAARKGSLSPQDAIAGVQSVGQTIAPAVDGTPNLVSSANANIIHAGLTNIAQTQGPGAGALAARGGYGGPAIDPTHRELLATQMDNQQAVNDASRVTVAQQNVNSLATKAAAGGFVSPLDAHAAATELASATTVKPIDTNPPDLTDFVQGRISELQNLSANITGPYAEAQLRGFQQIESQNLGKVVEQRLNGMPLDQQQVQVAKMADTFGADDPIVRHSMNILDVNRHLLTWGDPQFAPASAAMHNPNLAAEMSNALTAMQSAKTPADIGTAQGLMKTAVTDSFSAQHILGVAPGQEQVLTPEQAKTFGDQASVPGKARDVFKQISQTYGDFAPQALTEAFSKKNVLPGAAQLAFLNPNDDQVWAAANFQSKLAPADKTAFMTAIQNDPTFTAYRAANASNINNPQTMANYAEGLVGMADYFHQSNPDIGQSVAMAVNRTIGKGFVTAPSGGGGAQIAMPSNSVSSAGEVGDLVHKANTAVGDLGPLGSEGNMIDSATMKKMAISDGHWVYDKGNGSPQDARMSLVFNTPNYGPVRATLANGEPVSFLVNGLKGASITRVARGYDGGTGQTFDLPLDSKGNVDNSKYNQWETTTYWGPNKLNVDPTSIMPPINKGPGINPPISSAPAVPAQTPNPTGAQGVPTSSLDSKLPPSMKGLGPIFQKYGQQLGPNGPALLAAISMHETGRGTSPAYLEGHNAMGVSNSVGPISFPSVEDSIAHQAHFIATGSPYADFRKTGKISDLGASYAPVGAGNDPRGLNSSWAPDVSQIYQEMNGA